MSAREMLAAVGVAVGGFLSSNPLWSPIKLVWDLFMWIAGSMVDALPDAPTLDLGDATGWLKGYTLLNTFLPLSEALTVIGVIVAVMVGTALFRLSVTAYHLIPKPGIGT